MIQCALVRQAPDLVGGDQRHVGRRTARVLQSIMRPLLVFVAAPGVDARLQAFRAHRLAMDQNSIIAEAMLEADLAADRLALYGKNSFRDAPPPHLLQQFLSRFLNPLVLLLLFAGVISAATGNATSAIIIAVMVILSVSLDFIQQHRAERTAESLKQSVAVHATVMRNAALVEIDAHGIGPGDIVALRAGQLVPADGRVLASRDFFVKQAALTGEPYPVEKYEAGTYCQKMPI